jgi:hypothetical protein
MYMGYHLNAVIEILQGEPKGSLGKVTIREEKSHETSQYFVGPLWSWNIT